MPIKNNVTRMLDAKNISYTAHILPPDKLSAIEAAQILGVLPALMFKTIVATVPNQSKPVLLLVSADSEVDLKAAAKVLGVKKLKLASLKQAEAITGLQTGGISPLALLGRGFQVLVDSSAKEQSRIYLSGGQRGLTIQMHPGELGSLTGAIYYPISKQT